MIRISSISCGISKACLVGLLLGNWSAPTVFGAGRGAATSSASVCAPDRLQDSGAVYRICMPDQDRWNGELVVYAHGYVDPRRPIEIPEDQLAVGDGLTLPEFANMLGFAFATTSYRTNGLAIREGLDDLVDLVDIFIETHGEPVYIYLVGASEGGLITALGIERYPDMFDGGLATCGPIGNFREQIDYFGDFRVVFDHFFPDVLPGSAVAIPNEVIDNWEGVYVPLIQDSIRSDLDATEQLLGVTGAVTDCRNPDSVEATVVGLLWYNVHATNDAIAKLGGQPFDNMTRSYKGLDRPVGLNRDIERVSADPEALEQIELHCQTSGDLDRPLFTLHTIWDPIVPYWHERLYRRKVFGNGVGSFPAEFTARRYGHCNFTVNELIEAFAALVWEVRGEELVGVDAILLHGRSGDEFLKVARPYSDTRP